ncbi:MAG: glycosyltransferase [Ilumatobacteraceae bacterium]
MDVTTGTPAPPVDLATRRVIWTAQYRRVLGKALAVSFATPLLDAVAQKHAKTYTAMIRVRNEEEYLGAAVRSIIDHVDEVVIVDNMSDDGTPQIIKELAAAHPDKVRTAVYPYDIARYGQENMALYQSKGGWKSPSSLANFYNWCLSHCTKSFIVKWDGDTVATDALGARLEQFRESPGQALWHTGANLHENRTNLLRDHPYEDMEPRIYARRFARYDNGLGYAEMLRSPYLDHGDQYSERCPEPLYVHMKHCKIERYGNMSQDLQNRSRELEVPGEPVPDGVQRAIERWGLG